MVGEGRIAKRGSCHWESLFPSGFAGGTLECIQVIAESFHEFAPGVTLESLVVKAPVRQLGKGNPTGCHGSAIAGIEVIQHHRLVKDG